MKLLMLTEQNSDGISEVFYSIAIPEEDAPANLLERWRSLIALSPVQAVMAEGKENLGIGSTRDPETDTYTLADGFPPEYAKDLEETYYVFLIDNIVSGIYQSSRYGHNPAKAKAAFSAPVHIAEVSDNSEVELGYTWDGTNFYPPVIN